MTTFPSIQIQQQFGKIGMSAQQGFQSIQQPQAAFEMRTTHPKLDIQSPQGELSINQSRAWDALGVGNNLQSMSRLYEKYKSAGLQGIGQIVLKGNRLAAIHHGGNPIASLAKEQFSKTHDFDIRTPASVGNVDVNYTVRKPRIELIAGEVELNIRMNRPEINYMQGRVQYQMLQQPSLQIIPPQVDAKV